MPQGSPGWLERRGSVPGAETKAWLSAPEKKNRSPQLRTAAAGGRLEPRAKATLEGPAEPPAAPGAPSLCQATPPVGCGPRSPHRFFLGVRVDRCCCCSSWVPPLLLLPWFVAGSPPWPLAGRRRLGCCSRARLASEDGTAGGRLRQGWRSDANGRGEGSAQSSPSAHGAVASEPWRGVGGGGRGRRVVKCRRRRSQRPTQGRGRAEAPDAPSWAEGGGGGRERKAGRKEQVDRRGEKQSQAGEERRGPGRRGEKQSQEERQQAQGPQQGGVPWGSLAAVPEGTAKGQPPQGCSQLWGCDAPPYSVKPPNQNAPH